MARLRRFRHHRQPPSKLPVWAIVAICLGAAIVIAVIIGNLLKLWLDDETYQKLTSVTTETTEQERAPSAVRDVHAYPFELGKDPEEVINRLALSVSINDPQGDLQYTSPVALYQGRVCENEAQLGESIGILRARGAYVSGVFYSQALSQASTDLRYAAAAEEGALMREFLQMGGNEIVLCGLPFSAAGSEAIVNYLTTIKSALGDAPLGVAVPLSVAQDANGGLMLEKLLTVCDFCALDMTDAIIVDETLNDIGICSEADEALKHIQFYLDQYDMRLLLSEEQTLFVSATEMRMIESYQIISKNPKDTNNETGQAE